MPESAWKFLYYFPAWTAIVYIVQLKGSYALFQKPSTVWDDWNLDSPLPFDFYVVYMIVCSFYVHSLYATIFEDVWRRDSSMMVAHHILTLILLALSYSLRCHKIGLLVLIFHDISDIQLEFTKLVVYFKIQNGKFIMAYEIVANVMFCVFAVTWYVSRLYWFPLKALYAASSILMQRNIPLPFGFTMNVLLWILLVMNIYWFWFILGFIWRVVTGQMKEVDDTREYDVIERNNQQSDNATSVHGKNKILHNGISNINDTLANKEESNGTEILNGENPHSDCHQTRLRR
ncbi:ceramide synthase 1-like [Centruroides sculpturatus]|uniref:ceramide synthase 1-like n=1 Tax=Centruroides sculpturatus TaxID=218467 RepID=UPI000C6CB608|nr:ceramide synthase 1-like [Centruroides sculpturatus]